MILSEKMDSRLFWQRGWIQTKNMHLKQQMRMVQCDALHERRLNIPKVKTRRICRDLLKASLHH